MNWEAFNGITQFFATIATFVAIVVALYQSCLQFRTKFKLFLTTRVEFGENKFEKMYFVLKITNMSSYDIYINEAYISIHGDYTIYEFLNKPKIVKSKSFIELDIDAMEIIDKLLSKKHYNLKAVVITGDGIKAKTRPNFIRGIVHVYNAMEERNKNNPDYLAAKKIEEDERQREMEAVIDGWNRFATIRERTFWEKLSLKFKHIYLDLRRLFCSLKVLWMSILVVIFTTMLFFSIIGIIYFFKL